MLAKCRVDLWNGAPSLVPDPILPHLKPQCRGGVFAGARVKFCNRKTLLVACTGDDQAFPVSPAD